MLGLAGTGYFYLRLYEPGLPSILLLESDVYGRRWRALLSEVSDKEPGRAKD
jgi:hypothetical protein